MYNTIDSTPLGDVPWQSFTLNYNRDLPDGEVPAPWMEMNYNVWYRDPHTLIYNIKSNLNFKGEFAYAPYHKYSQDVQHCYEDMMSGYWAWKQAVNGAWFIAQLC